MEQLNKIPLLSKIDKRHHSHGSLKTISSIKEKYNSKKPKNNKKYSKKRFFSKKKLLKFFLRIKKKN